MTAPPPNAGSSKTETAQAATTHASGPRPEMTVEELLNFSFRDATTAKVGNIVRGRGLSCS